MTLELDAYWQLVEDTRQQAVWAKSHPAHEVRPAFLQAANLWESVEAVWLPNRSSVPVDTSAIVAELRIDPPDPQRLETLLTSILDQRQTWPQGSYGAAEIYQLKQILAKSEYQWTEEAPPSPLEAWLAQQFERFANWLGSALEGRISMAGVKIGQLVLIALGALALVFVFGYLWRGLRGAVTADAQLAIDDHLEENLSAGAALRKAQEMSTEGDYRSAVRYLYLAALLQLEERHVLRYDRSKTNREYLNDIRRQSRPGVPAPQGFSPGLFENFAEVVDVFDRVWYGFQPLDQAAYERYADQVARLRKERSPSPQPVPVSANGGRGK